MKHVRSYVAALCIAYVCAPALSLAASCGTTGGLINPLSFCDIPTFIEGGVKDFTASSYIGILAPTGTPPDIIAQLQKTIASGLEPGPTASKLREMGSEIATPTQMTPAGFTAFIQVDYERMREAAKLAGLTPT